MEGIISNQRFTEEDIKQLQKILSEDYGRDLPIDEVLQVAYWLIDFYTDLIKLAAKRRLTEAQKTNAK